METATKWLTRAEETMCETQITASRLNSSYPTFTDVAQKMSLEQFARLAMKLDPRKTPKNFKQAKAKAALRTTLITYAEAELMVALLIFG